MNIQWEKYRDNSLIDNHNSFGISDIDTDDAYASDLKFGTAGIRGKIGLGPNRLNRYTVEKVALGLAQVMFDNNQGIVVIGYDIRHLSREFAEVISSVLIKNGIKVYLAEQYITTPELSFFVRSHNADYGIMITASHNPPEYNGIKVYGPDGAQLTDVPAKILSENINEVEDIFNIQSADFQEGLKNGQVEYIKDEHYIKYESKVKELVGDIPPSELKVVFSSLHGTSLPITEEILKALNFSNLHLVENECKPDSDFTHVTSPNPEDVEAFNGARELGRQLSADLLIATDPDADRIGVEVLHNDEYIHLNGNQLGAILLYNRLEENDFGRTPVIIKSIVTSDLSKKIAEKFGAELIEVLTGFKYIGEIALQLEEDDIREFAFGYEESYGYLIDDFVRDKDAIQIVPVLIKLASQLHNKGQTLVDYLNDIYQEFGHQMEKMFSHTLEGIQGEQEISEIMNRFRADTPLEIEGRKVVYVEDFLNGERHFISGEVEPIDLPKANVIKLHFEDGWIALRPSGTEPKIKLYVSLQTDDIEGEAGRINDLIFGSARARTS